jgi:hypothetical protein
VAPEFAKIAQALKSKTYFVESADEYVDVPNLIADPALLDDAASSCGARARNVWLRQKYSMSFMPL